MATSPLYRRVTCGKCNRSILWPVDEHARPICESCWDVAADEEPVAFYPAGNRHPWKLEDLATIAREIDRLRGTADHRDGLRGAAIAELAERYDVSPRTIHRVFQRIERATPVIVSGWGALFTLRDSLPPLQLSGWQLDSQLTR